MSASNGVLKSVVVWYRFASMSKLKVFLSFFSGKSHLVDVEVREGTSIRLLVGRGCTALSCTFIIIIITYLLTYSMVQSHS